MGWPELAPWWLDEIRTDPAYVDVVDPLLTTLLHPGPGRYLDLGCGEGRLMRVVSAYGATVHGVDLVESLAALTPGPSVVARLPELPIRSGTYDGAYSVLTLEHVPDHRKFFAEAARVVKTSGVLAVVVNHPAWTAPDATPISDQYGEVLWRPGEYFSEGVTEMPAGDSTVVFHHRSMSALLNSAADAGWSMEAMVEQPHHELTDQSGIPRLLGCRWQRVGW